MSERLSYDRALELLREVVAEFGEDYKYPHYPAERLPDGRKLRCFYVRDDQPSCIVAHVLHRAGIPVQDLVKVEGLGPADTEGTTLFGQWADLLARQLLREVQVQQDEGETWGNALQIVLDAGGPDE